MLSHRWNLSETSKSSDNHAKFPSLLNGSLVMLSCQHAFLLGTYRSVVGQKYEEDKKEKAYEEEKHNEQGEDEEDNKD